jgi:D-alanyl-D-alanine carboxypeptidase (penicillin-binding protein 5/6)
MSLLNTAILLILGLLPGHLAANRHLANLTHTSLTSFTAPAKVAEPAYQPVVVPIKTGTTTLQLSATSAYAVDLDSGTTLYALHADTQRPIASVTKLATALVIARQYQDGDIITVPQLPVYQPADEIMGLQKGERFTVHDLLSALLINSEDDAADALGIATSGSQAAFAVQMNRLLSAWGVTEAHFSNPSGLTDAGNGASAKAVAQIAELALQNPTIKQLVATPAATIHDTAGRSFTLTTTDTLLQSDQFQGIKTGYTPAAGECFVGLTTIQGHPVMTVVLGSQNRFGDTQQLADWINQNYRWQ